MVTHARKYAAILVGGGPAGIAVLLNAHRDGILPDLLQRGLLIVERTPILGGGQLAEYVINSDSTGDTFLDPLRSTREPALHRILDMPVARRIAAAAQGAVPLKDVGELMMLIGDAVRAMVSEYPQSRIVTRCTAQSAKSIGAGRWRVTVTNQTGESEYFETSRLVLATGAGQPTDRLLKEHVAGKCVEESWGGRLKQSGEVLTAGGLASVAQLLRGKHDPKVAILGGSTSAMSVAHALLHRLPGVCFGKQSVTVIHRKPLRVYYPSTAEALADGYHFSPEDLCPVTRRVFRFAGLRLDSRELLMQVCGIGGHPPEPRVALHQLKERDAEAVRLINAADLVVAAFGYRPNALPFLDRANRAIRLLAQTGPAASLVDDECRVLRADGVPLPGVYGIGLAAGYKAKEKFGGEPSFSGQANGLWLWQNGIGSIIARALLTSVPKTQLSPGVRPVVQARTRTRCGLRFAAMGVA